MRPNTLAKTLALALIAGLAVTPGAPATAAEDAAPECRRFVQQDQRPQDFAPRLGRLCERLVESHNDGGLSDEELDAATRLGHYLAVLGELDLRRGAAGIGTVVRGAQPTTETARYLIAYRIGLLRVADRLAPNPVTAQLR